MMVIYRKACNYYYLELLISHNEYSKNDLIRLNKLEILESLNNEIIEKQMIEEYNNIFETLEKWRSKYL